MKKKRSRSQLKAIFANLGGLARGLFKVPTKELRSQKKDVRARGGQALSRFLRESKGKALGKEEEQEIYKMLKSRDPFLRQFGRKKLLESHGGLVVSIAKKHQYRGLPLEDLIQEGNVGLMQALQTFNPSRAKFSTHATNWIRQGIGRAIEEHGQVIRQPSNIQWELNKIRRASNKFQVTEGREPTTKELSKETNIPVVRLEKLEEDKKRNFVSTAKKIDKKDEEGGKQLTIEDILPSRELNPEEAMYKKTELDTANELENHLHLLMASQLSPVEKKVIIGTHGIIGDAKSFSDLGKELKLSKQRIHQIHQKALEKLRKPSFKKLKDFNKSLGEL